MALGAKASQVLRMVLEEGFRLVLLGASLGLIAALAVSRFLQGLLFGITAHDPATYVTVTALLLFVAVVAALIPARRATKIDPLIALRDE